MPREECERPSFGSNATHRLSSIIHMRIRQSQDHLSNIFQIFSLFFFLIIEHRPGSPSAAVAGLNHIPSSQHATLTWALFYRKHLPPFFLVFLRRNSFQRVLSARSLLSVTSPRRIVATAGRKKPELSGWQGVWGNNEPRVCCGSPSPGVAHASARVIKAQN